MKLRIILFGLAFIILFECRFFSSVNAGNVGSSIGNFLYYNEALCTAAKFGEIDKARSLIEQGANVDAMDFSGNTPLLLAAGNGNDEIVKLLLDSDVDVNLDNGEYSPLSIAAREGRKEIVKVLLEKQANVNYTNKCGRKPLMEASLFGHTEIVELLIRNGADVNASDNNGDTALIAAARHLWNCSLDTLKLLLDCSGIDVNYANKDGKTALLTAAYWGETDIVVELCKHRVKVDHRDADGKTALYYAVERNNNKMCEAIERQKLPPKNCGMNNNN